MSKNNQRIKNMSINFNNINSINNFNELFNKNLNNIDLNENDKSFENILTNKTNEQLYGRIENDFGNETAKQQTSQVENFLNGVGSSLEASVKSLNDAQVEAENAQVAFARGDDISVHEVMIAAEKSSLSMQMAIQLRNKIINAYTELNQIKV